MVVKRITEALGSGAMTLLGFAIFFGVFFAPAIVFYAVPDLAYEWTLRAAVWVTAVALLSLILMIWRTARIIPGALLLLAGALDMLFLWVWSVLIVGGSWGIVALYIANFFVGIGAVVAAFLQLLFSFHWDLLWQFVLTFVVSSICGIGGGAILGHESETPKANTTVDAGP